MLLTGTTILVIRYGLARQRQRLRKPVWAGGLAHLLPEQTYTATGFSNPVRVTFSAIFHPGEFEDSSEMVAERFRGAIRRQAEEVHVLETGLCIGLPNLAQPCWQQVSPECTTEG